MNAMNVVIIGCGGIGGTLAAGLARAGSAVTPVTGNAAIAEALATRGFQVTDADGTRWSVPSPRPPLVALDERVATRFDLCLIATQNPALESALASVLPHLTGEATVVVCQNGLPEERAARFLDRAGRGDARRLLGAVVGFGASMVAPGELVRTSGGAITIGRPSPASPDPAPLARLLAPVAEVRVAADLAAVRWSKLAINCVTTTLGAVGGERLGALLRRRFVRRLALEILAEVAAVARASGVRPAPLSGTVDIEKVAITEAERARRFGSPSLGRKHAILLAVGVKYRRLRSSMLYAIERGRPPEIDYLNGAVSERGRALGVPTPVNDALVEAVRQIAAGRDRPDGARPSLSLLAAIHDRVVARRPDVLAAAA